MNAQIQSILRCPACGSSVEPSADRFSCRRGHDFPIVNGVPRFVRPGMTPEVARTGQTFGFQWNRFEVMDAAEDEAVFNAKTGFDDADLQGKLVLDAGCGSGRYLRIAAERGATVVGVDLSEAVMHAKAATAHLPQVTVLQADLFNLPFAPGVFDYVYSLGVLHHTPSTLRAFQAVASLVKPGGNLAVWLYRRNTRPQEVINTALRALTVRLPIPWLVRLARAGAVVGGIPLVRHLNKIVNFSGHPRFETRVCDTFDWFAPPYQFHHTEDELLAWFSQAGFENMRVLYSQPSTAGWYRWAYEHDLLIGSGVNVVGRRRSPGRGSSAES